MSVDGRGLAGGSDAGAVCLQVCAGGVCAVHGLADRGSRERPGAEQQREADCTRWPGGRVERVGGCAARSSTKVCVQLARGQARARATGASTVGEEDFERECGGEPGTAANTSLGSIESITFCYCLLTPRAQRRHSAPPAIVRIALPPPRSLARSSLPLDGLCCSTETMTASKPSPLVLLAPAAFSTTTQHITHCPPLALVHIHVACAKLPHPPGTGTRMRRAHSFPLFFELVSWRIFTKGYLAGKSCTAPTLSPPLFSFCSATAVAHSRTLRRETSGDEPFPPCEVDLDGVRLLSASVLAGMMVTASPVARVAPDDDTRAPARDAARLRIELRSTADSCARPATAQLTTGTASTPALRTTLLAPAKNRLPEAPPSTDRTTFVHQTTPPHVRTPAQFSPAGRSHTDRPSFESPKPSKVLYCGGAGE